MKFFKQCVIVGLLMFCIKINTRESLKDLKRQKRDLELLKAYLIQDISERKELLKEQQLMLNKWDKKHKLLQLDLALVKGLIEAIMKESGDEN